MSGFPRSGVAALCVAALLVAGCGDDDATTVGGTTSEPAPEVATSEAEDRKPPPAAAVPEVECPPEVADCKTAGGEIVYVERVDPDGDGDAHFVLLSVDSITAPGLSVIDVRPDLRPDPLPGPGDLLAAAGPVYEGSYGQSQIQAEVVAVERRGHLGREEGK